MNSLQLELKIQKDIYDSVENYKSFIFNAGAGAGKTYALIEAIKHILNKKAKQLRKRNQRVACITYTNVAANEIKERLGETELVKVSTIHELLWEEISPYKSLQLMAIHRDNLNSELVAIKEEIKENAVGNLSGFLESDNISELLTDEAKGVFYDIEAKFSKASEFKQNYTDAFKDSHEYLKKALTNVDNFKKIMKMNRPGIVGDSFF